MSAEKPSVVVVGGGYAGVMAANRMQGSGQAAVTLVNPRKHFVERIRLHQLAISDDDAIEDYASLLNAGVRLVVDLAQHIDRHTRKVELASGAALSYDYLVYAVGSTGTIPAGVSGAVANAFPLSELEQAERLRSRLAQVPTSAPIVVVGGGLTGIETAAEFAEAGRDVTLVSRQIAPSLSRLGKQSITSRLTALGVRLIEGEGAHVSLVGVDSVELIDGRRLPSVVTVWTAGFGVPGLANASGLTTDPLGRLVTDESLTSIDDPRIVATGDAAAPSGMPYRMSCQTGLPLGAHAGDAVLRQISGDGTREIAIPVVVQCISLGRGAGTIQLQRNNETPLGVYVGGRPGAFVKERVCRQTLRWLSDEAEKPGSYKAMWAPRRVLK